MDERFVVEASSLRAAKSRLGTRSFSGGAGEAEPIDGDGITPTKSKLSQKLSKPARLRECSACWLDRGVPESKGAIEENGVYGSAS